MKGIVYDLNTRKVKYKFDTKGIPQLQTGEAIKLRDDIDEIGVNSDYDPALDVYCNQTAQDKDFKTLYTQAATTDAKLNILADKLGLL